MFGLLGVMFLAMGCQTRTETPTPPTKVPLSRQFRVESPAEAMPDENPVDVIWSSCTRGHRVGATSPFTVSVENVSSRAEEVRFCLDLLNQEGVVAEFAQQGYTLNPSMVLQTQVAAQFPDDIDKGAYGVALVVRDSLGADAGAVNVAVGKGADAAIEIPSEAVDEAVAACPSLD
jgi:hypothetical protein